MTADAAISIAPPRPTPHLTGSGRCARHTYRAAAVLLGVLALVVLLAVPAVAAPAAPIPGSPWDAFDQHLPYDTGVHKIARLAALASYALMTAAILLGVVLRMRYFQRLISRTAAHSAHMTIALSALIFGLVHGVSFLYQPVWRIGTLELLVPFTGDVQRIPVGFGILGLELAAAVGASVWIQRRIPYRRWLRVHQLAYLSFALIWLHIFTVHPEPRHLNLIAVGVAAGALICLAVFLIRVIPSRSRLRNPFDPRETAL
ncbi:ferric reductase-like transmembrane domain-containing protein [Kitasatospora sp. NPDC048540]|uniref:ferric reductase-like transmembrane domain-containing protein n=1 Tax=Kitasatospora sp. NPDC048540 TaxID=3155634 RepID=UPI0033C2A434